MSYNNKNFNPNVWDTPRQNIPSPFINNQQNFYGNNNNNVQNNFSRQNNFFQQGQQNNQIRPLLSINMTPLNDNNQHFRRFNNPDFHRNNNTQRGIRSNFQNTRWKDNRNNDQNVRESPSSSSLESFGNNTPNERVCESPVSNDESRPKSLVEQLKSTMKKNNQQQPELCNDNVDTFAKNASKKLLNQIKTMDKGNVKEMIKNPKQPHRKAVLNIHAREKLREGMRKQLKTLGGQEEDQDIFFETDESANFESIPQTLIAQIGHELGVDDMDLGNLEENVMEDKDMEVIKKNLGNDFLFGSELLLMNGFNLLGENETENELPPPPLPSEPSKPPEPVPAPDEAVYSSINKPWSPVRHNNNNNRRKSSTCEEWDLESAKNPDQPSKNNDNAAKSSQPITVITSSRSRSETPAVEIMPNVAKETLISVEVKEEHVDLSTQGTLPTKLVAQSDNTFAKDVWDENLESTDVKSSITATPIINIPQTPCQGETPLYQEQGDISKSFNEQQQQQLPPQRANETYGDYKRRINLLLLNSNSNENLNYDNFNKPRPPHQQQQQHQSHGKKPRAPQTNDWDEIESTPRASSANNDNWISNNRRSNNNNNNNNVRMSRFEQNRSRERNNFNNNNKKRSISPRDRFSNNSGEKPREDMKDGFNYRFSSNENNNNNNNNNVERLNLIIAPKGQFKSSFNKRSNAREKTPTPSNDGEFDDFFTKQSGSAKDARPCYFMLKKIMEIDADMTVIHDKMHGIDKVIQNLQSERVSYQKKFSQLQHDRKVMFDNLIKRSHYNDPTTTADRFENNHHEKEQISNRDKSRDKEKSPAPSSHKAGVNKKLEKMVEKKRKVEEPTPSPLTTVEEPSKKKKFIPVEEPRSAAQRQREKEEKELKERLEKIRKQKQLRREREELERRKLEEEAMRASNDTIIKLEKIEKPHKTQPLQKPNHAKTTKPSKITFNSNEILQVNNYKLKMPKIDLSRISLSQNIIDQFRTGHCPIVDEWNKYTDQNFKIKHEPEVQIMSEPESDKDPLAFEDTLLMTNPPTPGNNLTTTIENDENSSDHQLYEEWTGNFDTHETPIVFLQNIDDKFMVCAAEDGKLFKYKLASGKVDAVFTKHTQICNSFLYDQKDNLLYTASSDGSVFRIKFKSFQSINSKNFNESLQVIEKSSKSTVYIGAKSGNIFKVKSDLSKFDDEDDENNGVLCCVEGLILCLKASKEGPRSIILVASRGKAIQVRDANDGLLLRMLANEMSNVSVYDMALDGNTIYCGCNLHEIFAIDFTNGALKKKHAMLGAGAICVKIFKQYLIAACYDGNIYIFDINSDDDGAVNITGPSNMLLAMDLWKGKIIASTKDKTVKIINIPM